MKSNIEDPTHPIGTILILFIKLDTFCIISLKSINAILSNLIASGRRLLSYKSLIFNSLEKNSIVWSAIEILLTSYLNSIPFIISVLFSVVNSTGKISSCLTQGILITSYECGRIVLSSITLEPKPILRLLLILRAPSRDLTSTPGTDVFVNFIPSSRWTMFLLAILATFSSYFLVESNSEESMSILTIFTVLFVYFLSFTTFLKFSSTSFSPLWSTVRSSTSPSEYSSFLISSLSTKMNSVSFVKYSLPGSNSLRSSHSI